MYYDFDYGWSRELYLASEISTTSSGGLITTVSWYPNSTWTISNQSCYFKAVSDASISSNAWEDPTTNGATLVWNGNYNVTANSWSEIPLTTPFYLPPGMNLLVYWINNDGSYWDNTNTQWKATSMSPTYMALYNYQDNSFPTSSGNLYYLRPDIRFYVLGSSDDTNSVSLYEIKSPLDSVIAAPAHQVPVVVQIKNQGYGNLDSCHINWTINGIPQTSKVWKGHLPWDFNAIDTIGWYLPSVNKYDTLVIWTSLPNGVYDSTTFDDTIVQISFGITGLNMWYLSNVADTLYNTGPFTIQAFIASRTATPVPQPVYLHVSYTHNSITTYDSIQMNRVSQDTFMAIIPQRVFGTSISYYIRVLDAVGNYVTINNQFYIKRLSITTPTGYVVVGTGTNTTEYAPIERYYNYSWSRMLYRASELSATSGGGMITKLAWELASTCANGINQKCYFKEVADTTISNVAYIDPTTDGATLVWSGTINLSTTGWVELPLTTPFLLTPGKSLLVFWENRDGVWVSPYSEWYSSYTGDYMTMLDFDDNSFPAYSTPYNGWLDDYRPNARFYIIGGTDDTNSVAMHSIDFPSNSVMARPTGDSVGIKVTIKNKGIGNLKFCNVSWSLNDVYKGTKSWNGNLTEDFNDTLTVGYYTPRAGITDKISVWVSMPNHVIDSTTYDDTLTANIYGKAGIEVDLSGPEDTIYTTGSFLINARLVSLTSKPIDTNVFLYVSYLFKGNTTYDTLRMINSGNDTLWYVTIPQHPYSSHVTYALSNTDSIGNIIRIDKWFYIQRLGSGIGNDSIQIGTNFGSGDCSYPFTVSGDGTNWSRSLYLSSDIGNSLNPSTISGISFYNPNTGISITRYNTQCYMKVTSATNISTSGTYVDPVSDGATLVYTGTWTTVDGWNKFLFNIPFIVPVGSNLLVYWVDTSSLNSCYAGGGAIWWSVNSVAYTATDRIYSNFACNYSGGGSEFNIPSTILYFGQMSNDSNAAALSAIVSPKKITPAGISTPVKVVIKNRGMKNLTSCKIDWSLNGIPKTQYNWTGNLYEDFTDTVVIGNYIPNPANYDLIKVWVSLPNGLPDTTNFDDTLKVNSYAKAGLVAEYLPPIIKDTVYSTGPFDVIAHIQSTTSIPLPNPVMFLTYTYNNVTTYDTIKMTAVYVDSIFKVSIPQMPYGTKVTYSVTVVDSTGNKITISNWFYIKRMSGGGNTGYVIVGLGSSTSYLLPMDMYYCYSWTRQLYLANELSSTSSGGLITKLAWEYAYSSPYTYTNQTCYFEVVDASVTSISNNAYIDPLLSGATQVWTGTAYLSQGWVEFVLDQPFLLPAGKNLLIHWHHKHGSYPGSSYTFYYTQTANNTAVYCHEDSGFPAGYSGTLTKNRPNARFYIIGNRDDSNSVAITKIISPDDTVQAYRNTPVTIEIKNKGISNLTSCIIDWYINGVPQPRYYWTGNLMDDFMDTVTIGNFIPIHGNSYTLSFNVSLPNNVYDSTTYDDSSSRYCYADFHGVNLTMRQFLSPYNNPNEVCFPATIPVSIRVENTGTVGVMLNANSLTLHYSVNGPVSYKKNIVLSKGAFPVGVKDVIVDSLLDIHLPGIYQLEVYLTCSSDSIYIDDTIKMAYEVREIALPYDENFSSMPSTINIAQYAGGIAWQQTSTSPITPVFGTGVLYYNSALSAGSISSAMLYAIDLQGSIDPVLKLWFAHNANNATKNDRVLLKISTNGGASFSTLQTITRYNSSFSTPGWKEYTIDLSSYISQNCVLFAFEAYSEGGGDMMIDRILITSKQEMGIDIKIPDLNELIACDLNNQKIIVNLNNNTSLPIDFSNTPAVLMVEVSGGKTKTYNDTLFGILAANSTLDFVVDSTFDFSVNGNYHFKAYITSIDNNTNNDTIETDITISPDVSLESMNSLGSLPIHSQVYPTIKIGNAGNCIVHNIPLRIQVDGTNDITEIASVELLSGTDTMYTLQTPFIVPIEPTYSLSIISELSCDFNTSNDTLQSVESVNEPTLKVQTVLHPNMSVCDTGLKVVYPQITINNTGSPETDVVVYLYLDSNSQIFESFIDTIALVLSGTTNYTFKHSYIVPNLATNATYNVASYIYSPTYAIKQTACVIHYNVGVSTTSIDKWQMEQNTPNPVVKSTSIDYTIPEDGYIMFKVVTVSGQIVYQNQFEAKKGNHSYDMNVESLADGIYYYSMEYNGQRIIKKMTIQR